MHAYQSLADVSRVWIYQSNQPFESQELETVRQKLSDFASRWVSHNHQLKAYADVYYNRFVVLMVDESQAGASGCSIDASVNFLKQLESEFGKDLFNRLNFAVLLNNEVISLPKAAFSEWYRSGKIDDNTLVFDTLVATKKDFDAAFLKPLEKSWHKRIV